MPYVQRSAGQIVGTFANLQPGDAEEWLPEDAADVVAFSNRTPPARSVTRRQFMMALYVWNLKEAAEALVALAAGITAVAWAAATDFQSDDPMLRSLVAQLGTATNGQFTADQLQEFFDFAATL